MSFSDGDDGGGGSGFPADLTYVGNVLLLAAAVSGGTEKIAASNTSNTVNSLAVLAAKVAGTTALAARLSMLVGSSDRSWSAMAATSGVPVELLFDGLRAAFFDPSGSGSMQFQPSLNANRNFAVSYDPGGAVTAGVTLENRSTAAGSYLNLISGLGAAGFGVAAWARDTSAGAWKRAWDFANRAGTPKILVVPDGGDLLVGGSTATNVTNGFLHVPYCAGTPSGTPEFGAGALKFDVTAFKLWGYDGASWKSVAFA